AIALVLVAVFVPTAFIPGISGNFYRQFAITIAVSTIISAANSLTLSPALAGLLLKPHGHGERGRLAALTSTFATGFNRAFNMLSNGYARLVGMILRRRWLALFVYAGLIGATLFVADKVPRGFIPTLDQGYAMIVIQLPDGASLARTDAVVRRAGE